MGFSLSVFVTAVLLVARLEVEDSLAVATAADEVDSEAVEDAVAEGLHGQIERLCFHPAPFSFVSPGSRCVFVPFSRTKCLSGERCEERGDITVHKIVQGDTGANSRPSVEQVPPTSQIISKRPSG